MKKLIFILVVAFGSACQDIENCDTNDEWGFMFVQFLDKETNDVKPVRFTVFADDLTAFVPDTSYTSLGLHLNPNAESVVFRFDSVGTAITFEMEISYETQFSIFDDDCDPSLTFVNLDTVRYSFDSLSIPTQITNRLIDTNVQVFF